VATFQNVNVYMVYRCLFSAFSFGRGPTALPRMAGEGRILWRSGGGFSAMSAIIDCLLTGFYFGQQAHQVLIDQKPLDAQSWGTEPCTCCIRFHLEHLKDKKGSGFWQRFQNLMPPPHRRGCPAAPPPLDAGAPPPRRARGTGKSPSWRRGLAVTLVGAGAGGAGGEVPNRPCAGSGDGARRRVGGVARPGSPPRPRGRRVGTVAATASRASTTVCSVAMASQRGHAASAKRHRGAPQQRGSDLVPGTVENTDNQV